MASPAVRISRCILGSWSSTAAGIARTFGASSNVMQSRAFSDQGFKDPFLEAPLSAPTESPGDSSADPSLSFDSPAGSPISDGFPLSDSTPATPAIRTQGYSRDNYPPRNFRTPRGVYKAILLGEVGQLPVQKILKSGKAVTIFSVGTGGMYNNRRPFEGESPQEFAERSYTQWHRVAVYQDRVASLVMQHVKMGSQVYLEGNIESRVYNDPNSGVVKRIREIAIRANGRLMFMEPASTPSLAPGQRPIPNVREKSLPVGTIEHESDPKSSV